MTQPDLLPAALWLLDYLDPAPRLAREVRRDAARCEIRPTLLRRAAQALPLIRRPRELRGPWTWALPAPAELVRVRYSCPVADCRRVAEGWMQFRLSRNLFAAGLIRYRTRGTIRHTQPPESETIFVRIEPQEQE